MMGVLLDMRRLTPAHRRGLRQAGWPLLFVASIALVVLLGLITNPGRGTAGTVPAFSHVWVIFMENRDYTQVIGSPDAPYINQLARSAGLATQYYGIVHGSQPNYIAFFSGGTYGVTGGSTPNLGATNLVDQLDKAHRTWHVYAQNYPGDCYNKTTASGGPDGPGTWVRRHTPALAFTDIRRDPTRCAQITSLGSFDPGAASFELIVPNLTNSGHDGTTAQADAFLRDFVPRITGSTAWRDRGVLFIVWDEGREQGDNHIAALVISPLVPAGTQIAARFDHYSLLATIESAWHLGCLGQACGSNTLGAFFSH